MTDPADDQSPRHLREAAKILSHLLAATLGGTAREESNTELDAIRWIAEQVERDPTTWINSWTADRIARGNWR